MNTKLMTLCAVVAVMLVSANAVSSYAAIPYNEGFDSGPPLWNSEDDGPKDGKWYTDRYTPYGFTAADFDGDSRLKLSIDDAYYKGYGDFYATQGRKYDTWGAKYAQVDVYIPDDWASNNRYAGFWGTTFDTTGSYINGYPICAFRSYDGSLSEVDDAVTAGFYWYTQDVDWDHNHEYEEGNAGYVELMSFESDDYNQWYTLRYAITSNSFAVSIQDALGDELVSVNDPHIFDSTQIGNIMLQGYNFNEDYDVYFDNAEANVPEPATMSLLAIGGLALLRRRRKA